MGTITSIIKNPSIVLYIWTNTNKQKGGIFIPDNNFITTILNLNDDDIEKCDVEVVDSTVIYEIKLKRKDMYCDYCGNKMIGHGVKKRKISHPNIRGFNGVIYHLANRYICKHCNKTKIENNPFTFDGFNNSYSKIREVMIKLKKLDNTLEKISEDLHISTTQVNNYIDSYIVIPKLQLPEWIGIDELYSRPLSYKNAAYLCILIDGENRYLFDILGSRSKNTLSNYFSFIPKNERENVKYVTIDMWETYKEIAERYFPNCIVAVDPFHYVKHLCDGFQHLRINIMKKCVYGSDGYYLLKKWNWLFTSDDVDFDNEKEFNHRFNAELNRRDIFEMMTNNFPELYEAYLLKEEFRTMVKKCTYEEAKSKYDDLYDKFVKADIKEYYEFINILEQWKTEILNSFLRPYGDYKLTNAYTENINGKIGQYILNSRGLTNFNRFRKRAIFALNRKASFSITNKLKSEKMKKNSRGKYNKHK